MPVGTANPTDYAAEAISDALDTIGVSEVRMLPEYSDLDGSGVTTVLIDTGIDLDHAFFGPDTNGDGIDDRIIYQHDFADNDSDASDKSGHGSNVASLIASQDATYTGVAPDTNLIVLKVFKDSGEGTFGYLEEALQWVLANQEAYHIGVVNMSLGDGGNWTDEFSRYGIGDELAALAQTDTIIVAAAGNNYYQYGHIGVAYPASDPAVLAIGATWSGDFGGPWKVNTGAIDYTTSTDQICAFSQRDPNLVDAFAPGARFNGANATGGMKTMMGTSQAAAIVSGVATLSQQVAYETLGRGLTTAEFARLLAATNDTIVDGDNENDNVPNTGLEYGRIDFQKLVAQIATVSDNTGGGGSGTGSDTGSGAKLQTASGVYQVSLNRGLDETNLDFGNQNLPPEAVADAYTTDEDTVLNVPAPGLLTNDTDTEALTVSTTPVSGPSHGILQLNTDGSFAYTPDANYNGSDSFVYRIYDTYNNHSDATVTITVNAVNDAPVAQNLGVSTAEDTPYTGSIVMTDIDSGSLSASVVSGPDHGTLELNPDGSFTYTPSADFNGSGSFTYKANDGSLDSNVATVTITVKAVNDAPVAVDDSFSTDEDIPVTGNLLTNDSDVDSSGLRGELITAPAHYEAFSFNFDTGSFNYTPAVNWSGTDSFTYQAFDGTLYSNTATVTITVNAVNDAPVAQNLNVSTAEDTPYTGSIVMTDVDSPNITASVVAGPAHGTLDLKADGGFTYTPDANWNGVDSFTYQANDGSLDSNVATVTITVTLVNDAPVAQSFSLSGNEGTPISGNLLAHVTDVDSISLSASLVGGPSHGSVILNANGSFSYTPNFGYSGADSFTYKANDGELDSNTATVNLTVNPLSFRVIGVEQSPSEFKISFNHALDASVLNLYDAQSIHMGSADLTLAVGTTPVSGSMVIDASHGIVTFIKTGGVLAAGSYNLTLRSALDGFKDTAGNLLDGNADGTAGDNYSGSFSVSAPAQAVLSIPDFVRGPGQTVNVPATGSGIPVRLSNATGISAITFTLQYDPALLNITNVAMLQSCSSFTSSNINGVLTVTIEGLSATGAVDLVKLTANVPNAALYRHKQLLDLSITSVNGGSVTADDGLEVVAYLGDTSGNKIITTDDAQLVGRVLVRNDSGFGAFATVDPALIGDINGSGAVDVVDGSWIGQEANWYTTGKAAFNRAEIPDLPAGVTASAPVGPDPFVSIPTSMTAYEGSIIEVPVNVDPADGLRSAQIYLGYDQSVLELVGVQKGSLTQQFNMFIYGANDGILKIDLSGVNPVSSGKGSIAVALFRVKGLPASGTTSLDLQWVNLNDGQLVLTPAPVVGADPTDGRITFQAQEDVLSRNTTIVTGSEQAPLGEKKSPKEEPAKLVKWELPESGQVYSHAIPQDSQGAAPNWVKDFVVSLADYDKDPNSHIRVQVPAAKADAEAQVDEVLQLSRLSENLIDTLEIFW